MLMKNSFASRLAMVAGVVVAAFAFGSASAQSTGAVPPGIIAGGRPADNVSAGAVGSRAPGRMVSAGVGRAQGRLNGFFVPPTITETAPPNSQTQFLLDAIPVLFQELNRAVFAIASAILARDGIELPNLGPQFTGQTSGTTASALAGLLQKRTQDRVAPPRAR